MGDLKDKAFGGLLIFLSTAIFTYYSIWVFVTPFLAYDHFINVLFLPRIYAFLIPAAALVFLLAAVLVFFGIVTLSQQKKKKVL